MLEEYLLKVVRALRMLVLVLGYTLTGLLGVCLLYVGLAIVINRELVKYVLQASVRHLKVTDRHTHIMLTLFTDVLAHYLVFIGGFLWYICLQFFFGIGDVYSQV